MKRLKIGIFIDNFFPAIDGVVMVVDNYAKRLAQTNDVILFAPDFGDNNGIDDYSYKVVRIKSINTRIDNYYIATPIIDKKLKKILKQEKFDIIHIHSPFSIGSLGIKIAKKQDIPVIATMHTQFEVEIKRYITKEKLIKLALKKIIKPYNKCFECWAVNSEVAKVYKGYGYKREPKVVMNGTDMLPIKNDKITDAIIDKKYDLIPHQILFLFVGRIDKVKNIDFIIESLKIVKEKGLDFKMFFVGSGEDEKYFKRKVKKYDLEKEILFLGKIKDRYLLAMIYKRATLFLFPSLMDASSLVQVEAASQKTPVLFLKGAVTACNIKDNINGFLEENNPTSYASRIIKIVNDKRLYNRVSRKCYKDLYKSWNMLTKIVYKDYLNIIDKYKSKSNV